MNRRVVLLLAAVLMGACTSDLSRARSGDRNPNGADLSGADLTDARLAFADLTNANLSGADLSGANLTQAYLRGANLGSANLTGANLTTVHCDATPRWPAGFTPPPYRL